MFVSIYLRMWAIYTCLPTVPRFNAISVHVCIRIYSVQCYGLVHVCWLATFLPSQARRFFRQIISAVDFCHKHQIWLAFHVWFITSFSSLIFSSVVFI